MKHLSLLLLSFCLYHGFTSAQTNKKLEQNKTKIAILVYPGVELLDFSGPAEVFSNVSDFQTYFVSTGPTTIQTKNNSLTFTADYTVDNAPQPDILVIPGAPMDPVTDTYKIAKVIEWIKGVNQHTIYTMSVCTGAFILSKTGLLDHKTATSHIAVLDSLQRFNKNLHVIKDIRFVQDGKFITTAGISAGIDGSLHVVELLKGMDQAILVTKIMQYDKWVPEGSTNSK